MKNHKSKSKLYENLKLEITRILYDIDPMGISMGPEDEYSPEAELIVIEIKNCKSIEEVYDLICRVFVNLFGTTFVDRNPSDKLSLAAKAIYDMTTRG